MNCMYGIIYNFFYVEMAILRNYGKLYGYTIFNGNEFHYQQ